MPDTHLAMPWSLSADQARTLEATFQAPMMTSDASPNGTAAAAAAFARLLASGDQTMQPETEISNTASHSECKPLSLREALLGSSTIHSLGTTFSEANAELSELVVEPGGEEKTDEEWNVLHERWAALETAILSAAPSTLLDTIAVLGRVVDTLPDPLRTDGQDIASLPRVLDALRRVRQAASEALGDESAGHPDAELLSAFARWMAQMRVVEAMAPTADEDDFSDACDVATEIAQEIAGMPAVSATGLAVKIYLMAHTQHGGVRGDTFKIDLPAPDSEFGGCLGHVLQRSLHADTFRFVEPFITAGPLQYGGADAELLVAYNEVNKLRDWMDGPEPGEEDIPDDICRRYNGLLKLVAMLPAYTAAGVAAKLSTFTHEIQGNVYSHKAAGESEGWFPMIIRTALESAQRVASAANLQGSPLCADAGLLAAFEDYCAAVRRIEEIRNEDDPEQKGAYERKWAAQDIIGLASPQTPAGLVAFLKVAFQNVTESAAGDDAVFNGKPMPDDEHACMGGAMIWRLITLLDPTARSVPTSEEVKAPVAPGTDSLAGFDDGEKEILSILQALPSDGKQALLHLGQAQLALQEAVGHARKAADGRPWIAGRIAAEFRRDADDLNALGATPHPDAQFDADAFNDTVTAFEAEAPITLALPLKPTGRMIEAGATAAGITPEQFQAAYVAAVEALQKERAA